METDFLTSVNHKQMLLDWINTIDEPRCMIVSSLEDLKCFLILTDIIKSILRALGKETYNFANVETAEPNERIEMIINILSEFYDETLLRENFSYEILINSKTKLIELLQFLKMMHENILQTGNIGSIDMVFVKEKNSNLFSFDGTADLVYSVESKDDAGKNNNDYDENQNENQYFKEFKENIPTKIVKMPEVEIERCTNKNKNYNADNKYNFKEIDSNVNRLQEKNKYSSLKKYEDSCETNKYLPYEVNQDEINENYEMNNDYNDFVQEEFYSKALSKSPIRETKNRTEITYKKELTPSKNLNNSKYSDKNDKKLQKPNLSPINRDNNYPNNKNKVNTSINVLQTSTITYDNNEDTKSRNNINTISQKSVVNNDHNNENNISVDLIDSKLTKREENELYMNRGIPITTIIDISNHKLKIFRFFRPTHIVKNVELKYLEKYLPSVETAKTNIISSKIEKKALNSIQNNNKIYSNIQTNLTSNTIKKEEIHQQMKQKNIINYHSSSEDKKDATMNNMSIDNSEKSQNSRIYQKENIKNVDLLMKNYHENSYLTTNKSKPDLTDSIMKVIYDWILSLNILGEKKFKIDDLPINFDNGIVLCDLINRMEGREEVLKGIHRKILNKSQKLVNINKVLDFLRKNEKVNPRHLWETNQIALGDNKVIWELLHDIWSIYNTKIKLTDNKIKKSNSSSNLKKPINCILKEEEIRKPDINIVPLKQDNFGYNNYNYDQEEEPTNDIVQTTKYSENYYKVNKDKLFNKYSDIQNYQNALYNNISLNVAKHSKTKSINDTSIISRKDSKKCQSERLDTENRLRTANSTKNNEKEKSCFITFENSNVHKLKKEIERQSSKTKYSSNSKQDDSTTERSLKNILLTQNADLNNVNTSHITSNNINTVDFMKFNTKRSLNIDSNKKSIYINTDPSSPNKNNSDSRSNLYFFSEKIKNWLINLGINNVKEYDFTKDNLQFFKDGLLLSKIMSVLERCSISGINYNAKNHSTWLNNIRKSLEILRTKRNMPLDYLWSDEEIASGNGEIIRGLMLQIINIYKEKDFSEKVVMKRKSSSKESKFS